MFIRESQHKRERNDTHGFLRVVVAVAERHESGGEDLQLAEDTVNFARVDAVDDPGQKRHEHKTDEQPHQRRGHHRNQNFFVNGGPDDAVAAHGRGKGRAHQRADDGVRRTGRQALVPGDEVPDDGGKHRAQNGLKRNDVSIDEALTNRGGNLGAQQRADEIQNSAVKHRRCRAHDTRRDDCRDGIRGIVKAVDEIENKRKENDHAE